jgi:hypothetical protein
MGRLLLHRLLVIGAFMAVATPAARAAAPTSRFALANRCFALSTGGRYVASAPSGYSAGAAATPFYFKPTGLGTYMLYDTDGKLLTVADPVASGSEAAGVAATTAGEETRGTGGVLDFVPQLSPAGNAIEGAGGAVVAGGDAIGSIHGSGSVGRGDSPGPLAEWTVSGRGPFRIASTADGEQLTVAPDGTLTLGGGSPFSVAPHGGCRQFPEAQLGATGTPFHGTNRDGTVSGFADFHLEVPSDIRAGGDVIYGENFDRFGITRALGADGDERAHGPNGVLDVTGNLLRSGSPAGTHDNHGWPTFAGWPVYNTLTHQQIYWVWLERAWMAGLRLIEVQTAEDDELCRIEPLKAHSCDETESIKLQIARLHALQDYIDAQSGGPGRGWFRIVYDPAEARRVIRAGKLAVVIGVESSNPFGCREYHDRPLCTRAGVARGIDQYRRLGIRAFFVAHWVDNAFAGAAFEPGAEGTFLNLFNKLETGHYFRAGPCPESGEGEPMTSAGHHLAGTDPLSTALNAVQAQVVPTYPGGLLCNVKGLTPLGRYLVHRMIAEHMLIDVDHLSEKARESVLKIAAASRYPLVSGHTGIGGEWPLSDLRRLYAVGGLASVTPNSAPLLDAKIAALRTASSPSYFFGVGFGNDTGGFNSLPAPRPDAHQHPLAYPFTSYDGKVTFVRERTGDRTFDLNVDGVAHYGLIADLVADMQQQPGGAQAVPLLFRSAEAYLEMWQRAER